MESFGFTCNFFIANFLVLGSLHPAFEGIPSQSSKFGGLARSVLWGLSHTGNVSAGGNLSFRRFTLGGSLLGLRFEVSFPTLSDGDDTFLQGIFSHRMVIENVWK
jgi:hypothetical protein